jgi:CRP-like cAMP-binding protein
LEARLSDLGEEPPFSCNLLLSGLAPDDQRLLKPHLIRHEVNAGKLLQKRNCPIRRVHFVESGLIATMAHVADRASSGIGLIGRRAMAGSCVAIGADNAPFDKRILMSTTIWSIDRANFDDAMNASSSLRGRILRFIYANSLLMIQMGLAKAHAGMNTRLAFLLLTAHDSIDGDDLLLTHETIGSLLGVRRASATIALHELEGFGFISSTRGRVTIRDRQGLEQLAGAYYGAAEAEYERLLKGP